MRVAIDMDDVLVDFIGGLLAAVKTEYGVEVKPSDIKGWDLKPVLDPIIGRSWWAWLRDREWLWANFEAVDGAIGSIDRLRRDGHWVELVTSKPEWAEHNVFKWLGKWRPAFQRVTIVKVDDNKADFTDADVLIDDKPQNCLDFIATGRKAILFSSPHNWRFPPDDSGLVRANSWPIVVQMIETLETTGGW